MGLLWNTKATIDMIARINLEFSGDARLNNPVTGDSPPIKRWQGMRDLFKAANHKELNKIAADGSLFGGGVAGSSEDQSWQSWLSFLGDSSQPNGNHEKLRKAIYQGLDNTQYKEIVFSVLPIAKGGAIKVKQTDATDENGNQYSVILVETPTVAAVQASIKRRKAARSKSRRKKAKM